MREITPIIYKVDGGYAGYAAELPGATGQGKTLDEVIEEIQEAVKELIREYTERKISVPWRIVVPASPLKLAL